MSETTTVITKDQYLSMTPDHYLAQGFRDSSNAPRPELTSIWATAGATQLQATPPRQLGTIVAALREVLPLHAGSPAQRYLSACHEAMEVVQGVLLAPVHPKLAQWLTSFTPMLRNDTDLQDLLTHVTAVARQHALFEGMRSS
jgi:hypothetical protein